MGVWSGGLMEALGLGERGLADSSEIARKGIDEP